MVDGWGYPFPRVGMRSLEVELKNGEDMVAGGRMDEERVSNGRRHVFSIQVYNRIG